MARAAKTEMHGLEKVETMGPILFFRAHAPDRVTLAALVVRPAGEVPGALSTEIGTWPAEPICSRAGLTVFRYSFALPARADAWYELEGARYQVNAHLDGDLRLAYVSCNGQEHGDLDRPEEERNAMWRRMGEQHRSAPFHLLLHGGDQIYADEVTRAHPASEGWPDEVPADREVGDTAALSETLRHAFFVRYVRQWAQPGMDWLCARVPSLAMWDDHDICDGWGSLQSYKLDSAVGRTLFAAAREHFELFQFGTEPGAVPPICLDETGTSLSWAVTLPGLRIVAPDLRSERRRDRVMGEHGWTALRRAFDSPPAGKILVLSSVPALGPRLSLIERLLHLTRRMEKYEDDLRDQWQSRAHRGEWQRFLKELAALHAREGPSVTVLSGEIHVAARGVMRTPAGDLHQLVASGIAHPPPPRAYARALGALASLGSAPLRDMPITLRPLPGQRRVYTSDRNYLVLERVRGRWTAHWELEADGATPRLSI